MTVLGRLCASGVLQGAVYRTQRLSASLVTILVLFSTLGEKCNFSPFFPLNALNPLGVMHPFLHFFVSAA